MGLRIIGTATAQSSGNVSTQAIILPPNIIANDLILIFPCDTADDTWTVPTGYTRVTTQRVQGTSLSAEAYRKIAAGTEGGTTVTLDPSGSQRVAGIAVVLREQDTTTPLDVTITEAGGSSANVTAPTLTPVTSGCLELTVHAVRIPSGQTSNAWGDPSGFTQAATATSSFASNSNASIAVYSKSGLSTSATGAVTAVSQFSGAWIAFNVAVRPASGVTEMNSARIDSFTIGEQVDVDLFDDSIPSADLVEFVDLYGPGSDETVTTTFTKALREDAGYSEVVEVDLFDDHALLPEVHPATLRWYYSLPEFYRALDSDFTLLRYLSLLGDQVGEALDLAGRIDVALPGEPGYDPAATSDLADPSVADFKWLPWIGQFLGRDVQGLSEQSARDTLASQGFLTGNAQSIADAARSVLTGTRYVKVYPRSIVLPGDGGEWDVLIVTRPTETTDSASVIGAVTLAGVKPAGVVLHHEMYVATYQHLKDVHGPHYTDFTADFPTYADATNHIPE